MSEYPSLDKIALLAIEYYNIRVERTLARSKLRSLRKQWFEEYGNFYYSDKCNRSDSSEEIDIAIKNRDNANKAYRSALRKLSTCIKKHNN